MARRPKLALGPTPSRSAQEEAPSPGAVQKYWTPNMGCNIRVDLSTGVSGYKEYLESISWAIRCGLRHCGGDNTISYFGSQNRKFPKTIWPAMIKVKPESVPLYLGHQEVSAYFPFGEMAVTNLIEGQLAFLHHVRTYEDAHPGTRLLQRNLCWKIEFLNCCLGASPAEQLNDRRIHGGGRSSEGPAEWMGGEKQQITVPHAPPQPAASAGEIP